MGRAMDRTTSMDRALASIRDGSRVFIGSGAAAPTDLVSGLCERGRALSNVEVCHILTLGDAPYLAPEFAGHLRLNAFFLGANTRKAVQEGRADFTPALLHDVPSLLRSSLPIDVALVQVSEPDARGMCSLGVSVDVVRAAVDTATIVIAEVNPRMPRTLGVTVTERVLSLLSQCQTLVSGLVASVKIGASMLTPSSTLMCPLQ